MHAAGKLFDDRLSWLVGANYVASQISDNLFVPTIDTTQAYAFVKLPNVPGPFAALSVPTHTDSTSGAIFGNVEYRLLDSLSLHAGARYTDTDISYVNCTHDVDGNAAAGATALETLVKKGVGVVPAVPGGCVTLGPQFTPYLFKDKLDQDNVSWRLGADWTPFRRTLVYASISKGYKAGSFPTAGVSSYLQLFPVTQESVLAYEVGVKTHFDDNKLEFDGSVFHYDYDNKQVQAREPDPNGVFGFLQELINIPKSTEDGVELAARYRPVSPLLLTASVTYIDSRIDGHPIGYTPYSTAKVDLGGEPLPNTPKWAAEIGARYEFYSGPHYAAYVGGDARYQSRNQAILAAAAAQQQGFPSLYIDDYAIFNLRAGVNSVDGHWMMEIYGNNVTNTYYWASVNKSADITVRYAGMPAIYGARIGYKF